MRMLLLLVACGGPSPDETAARGEAGFPPSVVLDLPATPPAAEAVRITGQAADPEDDPEALLVTLGSDLDGLLFEGAPEASGFFEWSGALTPGEHVIRATAVDPDGNEGAASGLLVIAPAE